MLRLPFYRQQEDFDCGPTALKMVLAYFGTRVPVRRLCRSMRTTAKTGTTRRAMLAEARRRGLRASARSGLGVADLRRAGSSGYPVIVNYLMPVDEVNHYAVVAGFRGRDIVLWDPDRGSRFHLPIREFNRRWQGLHGGWHAGWGMIVGPARPRT